LRVLMLTPYMKPVLGGISTYLEGLTSELRRQNAVCVVVSEKGKGTTDLVRTDRSHLRFISEGILSAFSLRPDVIHIHSNWRGFLVALAYKRLFRCTPVFFTFHTDSLSPLSGLKRRLFESMLQRCDTLVFTSTYLQSETEASLSIDAKSRVIYAGVSRMPASEKQVREFRERHSLHDRFPVLLYMTPFVWKEKVLGIEILGKALRNLERHSLKPSLVVLGEGELRSDVERRIRELGLDDIVLLVGRMDNPSIALSACDIYTHISMRESLSMSILEAMSEGKPVIATDVGGTREILADEHIGILVSPDLAGMGEATLSLCSDRGRMMAMGTRAREWVEAEFTWEQSAKNHLRLYKEALGET